MTTITEKELSDSAQNHAVTMLKVTKAPDESGWIIYVNLNWKEGDFLLITSKRKPRTWVSMDRLFKHIEVNYGEITRFAIFLRGKDDEPNEPSAGPPDTE